MVCATIFLVTGKATTVTIQTTTVAAGTTKHWYVSGTGVGWQCTKGDYQSANLELGETGYNIKVGLMDGASGTKYAVFLSSTNYKSKTISKKYLMTKSTALYKPYITNSSKVSMTVSAGGTFVLQ